MEFQKLTVHTYSETIEDERRITIAPMKVVMIAAKLEDIMIRGLSVRPITVLFDDGEATDLVVNSQDLLLLEDAVGSFCLG